MFHRIHSLKSRSSFKQSLNWEQLISIIKGTASYQGLVVSPRDRTIYDGLRSPSALPADIPAEKYFFGNGLVNAEAAVKAVKQVSSR